MPLKLVQVTLTCSVLLFSAGGSGQEIRSTYASILRSKEISPEATRALPAQSNDRGRLMPLHAVSVMEWLCGDPNVQAQLRGDRKSCYVEMQKGLAACQAQLQTSLPTGRSKAAASGKPDILEFRRQLRQCIQQAYVDRQLAAGKAPGAPRSEVTDPLSAAMQSR